MSSRGSHGNRIPFVLLAAKTATFNSEAFSGEVFTEEVIFLEMDSVTGTSPTLDVIVQIKDDAADDWHDLASFAQKTAAGRDFIRITNFGHYLRMKCTIGGTTPSFTMSITGQFKP